MTDKSLNHSGYEDRILLKIRRKYSKDEELSLILKELSDCKIELGKAKSYISELKYINNKLLSDKKALQKEVEKLSKTKKSILRKELTKEDLKDELIVEHTKHISAQQKKIKHMQDTISEWQNKYFILKNNKL